MNTTFIKNRISILRTNKGVSEYKMSLDLGHSKGYIQSISSGKSLPSVSELLSICDYFEISPKDFFDENINKSPLLYKLYNLAEKLTNEDLELLINISKRLIK